MPRCFGLLYFFIGFIPLIVGNKNVFLFIDFIHFLCLPKENEPKEKAPFARWFTSDHEIFVLHAM